MTALTKEQAAKVIGVINGLQIAAINTAGAQCAMTAQLVAQQNPGAQIVARDKQVAAQNTSMPTPTQKLEMAFGSTQVKAQEAVNAYFHSLSAAPTPNA